MIEQQRTFGEIVGLEPVVPTKALPLDIIVRADGSQGAMCDSYEDCRGEFHSSEEDREAADITIVEEILQSRADAAGEYATENDDFASAYDCLIYEDTYRWGDSIEEWIRDNYHDRMGHGKFDNCMDDLVSEVIDDLDGRMIDADWKYNSNEYAAYSGSGCCLGGFDIGEQEEQVSVSDHPEFEALHEQDRLYDLLDISNTDAYVSLSKFSLRGDYPTFEFYYNPGGRWDCVVCEERMQIAVTNAILKICRK